MQQRFLEPSYLTTMQCPVHASDSLKCWWLCWCTCMQRAKAVALLLLELSDTEPTLAAELACSSIFHISVMLGYPSQVHLQDAQTLAALLKLLALDVSDAELDT